MRSPKNFLLLECESVKTVLQETLRHEYGGEGSQEFFNECKSRLRFIKDDITNSKDDEYSRLEGNAVDLNDLSDLIARIERSSISEYSWPFVDEFIMIADLVCTEKTTLGENLKPIMRVLSDGGLDKYAILTDPKRPSSIRRRIHTIVLPKSLKHYVLLHPVLGHELGHAILHGSENEKKLRDIIKNNLLAAGSKFENELVTAEWLYSKNAPIEIRDILDTYSQKNDINQSNFFCYFSYQAWIEEILCDLIGLVIFGPSFVAALCQLLNCLIPSGSGFSDAHPPAGCRINLMLSASRIMGYDKISVKEVSVKKEIDLFWGNLFKNNRTDPWFNIFSEKSVQNVIEAIRSIFKADTFACYPSPGSNQFQKLLIMLENNVPPIDHSISSAGESSHHDVDFRHILYAGWVSSEKDKIPFKDTNRLCEHAIMQNKAFRVYSGV